MLHSLVFSVKIFEEKLYGEEIVWPVCHLNIHEI
jgi:hypothetical protein